MTPPPDDALAVTTAEDILRNLRSFCYSGNGWMVLEQVQAFTGADYEYRMYNMLGDDRIAARAYGKDGEHVRPRRRSTIATIDAVALNAWPSRGMELHGIEIKVSRGDWLRELRDPVKTEIIRSNVDRIFVAAPEGVVRPDLDGDVLGSEWGWIDQAGTVRVQSPDLTPIGGPTLPRPFVAAMVRSALNGRTP